MNTIELGTPKIEGEPSLPQRDLTPQEATILWAHKVFDEYSALPQNNHRQRAKAERFVRGVTTEILSDPEKLGTAGSIWKSREEETPKSKRTFYSHVSEEVSTISEQEWEDFTSEQLSEIVRVLAHNELASEIAHNALVGYFKGPENVEDRVESLYKFTYGALDLIDDKEALEKALIIGNFQSDVIPMQSGFYRDFSAATYSMENDELLGKAAAIDHITHQLCYLTSLNPLEIQKKLHKFLATDPQLKERLHRHSLATAKSLGLEEIEKRIKALGEFYNLPEPLTTENAELAKEMARTWPFNVILKSDDPLRAKYNFLVKRRIETQKFAEVIRGVFSKEGKQDFSFLKIILPDGYSLELYYPGQLTPQKRSDLIRLVLKKHPLEGDLKATIDQREAMLLELGLPMDPMIMGSGRFDQPFIFTYHVVSGTEKNRHPILSLESIGFPVPASQDGLSIPEINETYAKQIKENQIRYLNRRGIRVPIKAEELQSLGYSYVDFYRDNGKTRVETSVNGLTYTFKLDANYNLDFEGKHFDSPILADFLRYTTLSLLRPILCDERIKGEKEEEISQEEREVITRMGHLRWLPVGQKYTKQAEENYLKIEGGDLAVKNLERRLDAERKQDPRANQYTTYVRPVTEPEQNLPPLVLHLPADTVKFR